MPALVKFDNYSFAASSYLSLNHINIRAEMPVVRSYGSVRFFTPYPAFLRNHDWQATNIPSRVVPVSHTLDLIQLAYEVVSIGTQNFIVSSIILISTFHTYGICPFLQ